MSGWGDLLANQVISWHSGSTNYYWRLFDTGVDTNTIYVSQAIKYFALGADGGLALQYRSGPAQYFPRSFSSWTNIVGVAGLKWTDTAYIFAIRSDGAVLTDEYDAYFRPPSTASNVVAIAPGASHALALRSDGTLIAWGHNINGVLNIPPGTTNVAAIVSGPYHSLALLRNGKVIAWGSNVYGQTNVPTDLSNVVAISTSQQHSLALKSDGTIVGWGNITAGSFHGPMNSISNVAAIASGWGDIAILTNGSLISFLPGYGTGYPKFLPVPGMVTNVVTAFADFDNIAISGQGLPRSPALPCQLAVPFGLPLALPATPGGSRALKSQWMHDFSPLENATNEWLFLNTVTFDSDGLYSAIISNWYGVVTNTYMVKVAPFIVLASPTNQTRYGGATAYFDVAVWGQGVTYQWTKDGEQIRGETNNNLTLTNVGPESAGNYSVKVSNFLTNWESDNASLTILGSLRINSGPQWQSVVRGSTAYFSVAAEGVAPLAYQWRFNGCDLVGQTNSDLALLDASPAVTGKYSVLVSNSYLALESEDAHLEVFSLKIISQPTVQSTFLHGRASFNVAAIGVLPICYQWQSNGVNIAGATSNSLVLSDLQLSDSRNLYRVVISNLYETQISAQVPVYAGRIAAWGDGTGGATFAPPDLTNVSAIAAGNGFSVAVVPNRPPIVWGLNGSGQANVPGELTNVISVAADSDFCLALRNDSGISGWGANTYGQLGIASGISNVVKIKAGGCQSIALKSDGTSTAAGLTTVPTENSNLVAVAAGPGFSVFLRENGTVFVAGSLAAPTNLQNIVSVSCGGAYCLALRSDGMVFGWGDNSYGQLNIPPNASNVVAISAGVQHALALTDSGKVIGWGDNSKGQANPPDGLQNVVSIAAGAGHSIALVGDNPPITRAIITSAQRTGIAFDVSIQTHCDHVYRLEYTDNLERGDWMALALVAGTGNVLVLRDPSNTASHRFYRVRRW